MTRTWFTATSTGCSVLSPPSYVAETQVGLQVNIFVDDRLSAKIADFGLAVISEATGGGAATTQTGLKGTVAWMSPERINGASRLAPSIDVYAFGILWLTVRSACASFSVAYVWYRCGPGRGRSKSSARSRLSCALRRGIDRRALRLKTAEARRSRRTCGHSSPSAGRRTHWRARAWTKSSKAFRSWTPSKQGWYSSVG
jgi:serine/threonine protein kinase